MVDTCTVSVTGRDHRWVLAPGQLLKFTPPVDIGRRGGAILFGDEETLTLDGAGAGSIALVPGGPWTFVTVVGSRERSRPFTVPDLPTANLYDLLDVPPTSTDLTELNQIRADCLAAVTGPFQLDGLLAAPAAPPSGKAKLYARMRAGAPWIDVMRPSGRDFPLQPHFGVNRVGMWLPQIAATVSLFGLDHALVGTVTTTGITSGSRLTSSRRWRVTSAALVDSAAEQRARVNVCWRGNAANLGGFTFVTRVSLATLQATGMGFFGLLASVNALATTTLLSGIVDAIGIGFQRGTHANWQVVTNDAAGAPTLTDLGASFPVATGGLLTLYVYAPPNAASVWLRLVDEVSGAVYEQEITADLPSSTTFLNPRLFMNNGATAAVVAYECTGVYLETDY